MMKHILARTHREILQQVAWSNALLAFDFDGTLAPIVADRERAAMRLATRRLLAVAAQLYPCIVISGRARADALNRLRGVRVREVIGNHGLQRRESAVRLAGIVAQWQRLLEQRLHGLQGVQIENKTYALAVHYRGSRGKKAARAAILAATVDLREARLIAGKQVVDVLPVGAPHKGVALQDERLRLGCDIALYVGDDETDEDVFQLDQPGRLVSIRVGVKRTSAASYFLRNQGEIDALLMELAALRRAS